MTLHGFTWKAMRVAMEKLRDLLRYFVSVLLLQLSSSPGGGIQDWQVCPACFLCLQGQIINLESCTNEAPRKKRMSSICWCALQCLRMPSFIAGQILYSSITQGTGLISAYYYIHFLGFHGNCISHVLPIMMIVNFAWYSKQIYLVLIIMSIQDVF